jgi:hypothetical protein
VCNSNPVPATVACSAIAGNATYGVPATFTVGTASYTTEGATCKANYGAVLTYNTAGCSPCNSSPVNNSIACSSIAGNPTYGVPSNYTKGTASYKTEGATCKANYGALLSYDTSNCLPLTPHCISTPTTGSVACSAIAGNPTYGVPASNTVGTATYTWEACTSAANYGAIWDVNRDGCTAPAPTGCALKGGGNTVNGTVLYTQSRSGSPASATYYTTPSSASFGESTGFVVYRGKTMKAIEWLRVEDLDVPMVYPDGLERVLEQGLFDLTPWHIMDREAAKQRLHGLRNRYKAKYVPFARRQDNDDIACIDPERSGHVVIVHDFAAEGYERRQDFDSFWDWFRAAVDDMIAFE